MIARHGFRKSGLVAVLIAASCGLSAQVYSVDPNAASSTNAQPGQAQPPAQQMGWGSNIENARLARAAELALQHGDHAQAYGYAQRAAKAAPNDPHLWFLLGYAARLDSRYQESADAYKRGLSLNASSVEGLSGLAQTYSAMGRNEDATRLLKQTVAADPRRRDDLVLLGDLSMKSTDYTGALEWLEKAERLKPDARSELLMAIAYQHLKQMDQANKFLELAKKHAPENSDVQRTMAGYYREVGNYSEAIAALKSIHNPKPDVTAELAYTYQLDGKLDDSAKFYAEAANAVPRDIGLQLSAAQAEVSDGAMEKANPFLKRAGGIDTNNYRLHAIRGEIAKLEERDQDAVDEYNIAVAHLPSKSAEGPLYGIQLHLDLMDANKSLGNDDAAHHELDTAQAQIDALGDSADPHFLRLRALIRMDAGNPDAALRDITAALASNAHDNENLQLDGDVLMKLGRVEDAIEVYKQVLSADANNRLALTSLGYASQKAGRDQEAEKYFLRLAAIDPSK